MDSFAEFLKLMDGDVYDFLDRYEGELIELLESGSVSVETDGKTFLLTVTITATN